MITRDLGPFGIFKRLRSISPCSKLLSCPFCTSIWLGALICVGLFFAGYSETWPVWIMLSLGLSGFTVILDRTWTADYQPK